MQCLIRSYATLKLSRNLIWKLICVTLVTYKDQLCNVETYVCDL